MTFLVLNRRRILKDLAEWFPDSRTRLVVLTERRALEGADPADFAPSFLAFEVTDDYTGEATGRRAEELCRWHGVTRVLTTAETDLVRAARLREQLGLPGQDVTGATAYTDKYAMKTAAAASGVPVAAMRLVDDADGLRDFAAEAGFPLVLKEVDGAAAIGMSVLGDELAVEEAAMRWQPGGPGGRMLAEAWIDGDVYHVNGLMSDGLVLQSWPSRYLHTQWSNFHEATPYVSGMLHPEEPLFARLQDATTAVVAALPPAPGILPFHAELFHTPDDTVALCEIACRAGGAGIVDMHERAFGINLYRAGLLGQAGRGHEVTWHDPVTRLGYGWFPPRRGVLRTLPGHCPLPRALTYTTSATPGRRYEGPRSAVDTLSELHFTIGDDEPLVPVLHEVERWWTDAVRWD